MSWKRVCASIHRFSWGSGYSRDQLYLNDEVLYIKTMKNVCFHLEYKLWFHWSVLNTLLLFYVLFYKNTEKTVLKSRSDDILNVTYILVAIISRCTWGNNMDKTLCSLSPSVQLALFCSPILLLRRQCENSSITFSGLIFLNLVTETGGQAHRQFVSK